MAGPASRQTDDPSFLTCVLSASDTRAVSSVHHKEETALLCVHFPYLDRKARTEPEVPL